MGRGRLTFEKKDPKDYIPEIVALAFLLLYVANYFYGNSRNRTVAGEWMRFCEGVVEDNFALVGKFEKESACEYRMYCSGRLNCQGVTIIIRTIPRHDMAIMLYNLVMSVRAEDTVTFEAVMGGDAQTGGGMENFNFAVCCKQDEGVMRSENESLDSKVTVRKWMTKLSDSLVCLSDEEEVSRELLPSDAVQALNTYSPYVKELYASHKMLIGLGNERNEKRKGFRAAFKLNPSLRFAAPGTKQFIGKDRQPENLQNVCKVAFKYIDVCASYRMSNAAKERMRKVEAQAEMIAFQKTRREREEKAQTRKQDKIDKEKAALENMTPEQAAKAEEKLLRKQRKEHVQGKMKIKQK